jgi:hypothetical protein
VAMSNFKIKKKIKKKKRKKQGLVTPFWPKGVAEP